MKSVFLFSGVLLLMLAAHTVSRSEEAGASIYVVDRSPEFAETGGACLTYTPGEKSGKERQILGIAKGPPGSTLLMIAFDRDALYLNLAPVIAPQTKDSKALRFPAEGTLWPYDKASPSVDLYVAVFPKDDPNLPGLTDHAEWIGQALAEGDKDTVMLHALAIKNRLSSLLRRRSVDSYRVKYSGTFADAVRLAPSSKAAVTRGVKSPLPDQTKSEAKGPVAAVRRGLKTLDSEWTEDSRAISFGPDSPGVLVFPITVPAAP